MAKAITQMARACPHCQRGKVHRHVHLQPAEIPVPHRRFAHIHVDLVRPLPPSRGHTYLFTIIERTSRWQEAILLASITAANCARARFAGWVSRFGVPATITSDRGAQFTSFLRELQTTMTGRPPPPAWHNAAPAPSTLPEELLLARFILVCRDSAQPPLSPIYDGPY
jgi:hypothetical protein